MSDPSRPPNYRDMVQQAGCERAVLSLYIKGDLTQGECRCVEQGAKPEMIIAIALTMMWTDMKREAVAKMDPTTFETRGPTGGV